MAKSKKRKFVWADTIFRHIGGGFSNPNQSGVYKIGGKNILLTRGSKLDKYGNPVHRATIIERDGSFGYSARTNGSASLAVSSILEKSGIDVRRKKPTYLTKQKSVKK